MSPAAGPGAGPTAARPHVAVLLATYNGAAHLDEFLDSLAAQSWRPDRLVLRDDGSSDDSVVRVSRWARSQGMRLQVLADGARLGPARAFLQILAEAGEADLYLFADQDDVWLPTKIERAVQHVGPALPPTLYASTLTVTDARLTPVSTTPVPTRLNLACALFENTLTGCTMAFNRALAEQLRRHPPSDPLMHDWWVYLVAAAIGQIRFDATPTVLYRQHDANTVGAGPRGWALLRQRLHRFVRAPDRRRAGQARDLIAGFAPAMDPAWVQRIGQLLAARSHPLARLWQALRFPVQRQTWRDRWATRWAIALGRF